MNLLDWFPMYVELWQGESVKCLSLAAQGAYMACLTAQFKEGSIPSDISKLARVIGADKSELESIWPEIASKFEDCGEGRMINFRMDQIRIAQEEKADKKRESGSKGGLAKQANKVASSANSSARNLPVANGKQRSSKALASRVEKSRERENTPKGVLGDKSPQKKKREPKPKSEFIPPTPEEVAAWFRAKSYPMIEARAFYAHHQTRDWFLSRGKKMSDWHMAVETWMINHEKGIFEGNGHSNGKVDPDNLPEYKGLTQEQKDLINR